MAKRRPFLRAADYCCTLDSCHGRTGGHRLVLACPQGHSVFYTPECCNNEYSFDLQESQRSACVSAFALLAFLRRSRGGACNSLGPQDLGICLTCGYPATSFNALTAVLGLPGAIRSRTMLPWLLHDYLILICTPRLTPLPASFCYGSPDPVAAIREVVRAVAAVGGRVAPAKSLCHLNI